VKKYKLVVGVTAILFAFAMLPAFKVYSIYMMANFPQPENFWQQSNEDNTDIIDHSQWQRILDNYLISDSEDTYQFKYGSVSDKDKNLLDQYIDSMQGIDPRQYDSEEQFAFWINLYNALTIKVVLDAYPVSSIREIGSVINMGPWDDKYLEMQGQELSLNNIEHAILRPIFADNRVHYAVNCASIGCPNLSPHAYTSDNLEDQLEEAATAFINSSKGVTFKENKMVLSSIYNWFVVDFGGDQESLIEHLLEYANEPLEDKLLEFDGDIDYQYDWQLNQP
jgi:hypothetical protein